MHGVLVPSTFSLEFIEYASQFDTARTNLHLGGERAATRGKSPALQQYTTQQRNI